MSRKERRERQAKLQARAEFWQGLALVAIITPILYFWLLLI